MGALGDECCLIEELAGMGKLRGRPNMILMDAASWLLLEDRRAQSRRLVGEPTWAKSALLVGDMDEPLLASVELMITAAT